LATSRVRILTPDQIAGVVSDTVGDPTSAAAKKLATTFTTSKPTLVYASTYAAGGLVTDDTTALQTALTAAAGGTLIITAKHKITGTLVPSSSAPTTIDLRPGAEIVQYANLPHLRHEGSAGTAINVSAGTTAGSRAVTVSAGHGLVAGSWIFITSDNLIPTVTTAEGMLRRVVSVSGNVINIDSPLYVALTALPRVHPLTLAAALTITGTGIWRQDTPATKTREMFLVQLANTPRWLGAHIRDGGGPALQVVNCEGGEFSGSIRDLLNYPAVALPSADTTVAHYGYGVNLSGGTRNFRIHSGHMHNIRHAMTTSGFAAGSGVDGGRGGPERCSIERSMKVTGIPGPINATSGYREISAGVDTHEQGWGNVIDADVDGCLTGVNDRARNTIIRGVVSGSMYGILLSASATNTLLDRPVITNMVQPETGQTPMPFAIDMEGPTPRVVRPVIDAVLPTGVRRIVKGFTVLPVFDDGVIDVPSARLDNGAGTYPVLTAYGSLFKAYQFAANANGQTGGIVTIPDEWEEFALYVIGFNPTTGTGDVKFGCTTGNISSGLSVVTAGVTSSAITTWTAGPQWEAQRVMLSSAISSPGINKVIRIDRAGADALDTLESAYAIASIQLVRTL
jgi:hypothetical protein